jgi:hypothetical protein
MRFRTVWRIPPDEEQRSRNGVVSFRLHGRLEAEKAVEQTICAFAGLPADAPARLTILEMDSAARSWKR